METTSGLRRMFDEMSDVCGAKFGSIVWYLLTYEVKELLLVVFRLEVVHKLHPCLDRRSTFHPII